jgi:hypothetical protein
MMTKKIKPPLQQLQRLVWGGKNDLLSPHYEGKKQVAMFRQQVVTCHQNIA